MTIKKAPLGKTASLPIPSQNLHIDPKDQTSYRAKGSYIAQGEKVTVKGTKTRKKQTATWF